MIRKLVSFMILIIAIGISGSIMLHMRGIDGEQIAIAWILYFAGIVELLVLIYLIIIPAIKIIKGKDDHPPELNSRASPVFRV